MGKAAGERCLGITVYPTPVWLIFGRTLSNLGGDALAVNADMQKPGEPPRKAEQRVKEINNKFREQKKMFESRIGWFAMIDATLYLLIFVLIFWAFGLEICGIAMLLWATDTLTTD